MAKGDQKQKLGVKLREYFIVKDQSFKKLVAKIWLVKWHTLKERSVRQSCETLRFFESLNGVLAFTANG